MLCGEQNEFRLGNNFGLSSERKHHKHMGELDTMQVSHSIKNCALNRRLPEKDAQMATERR